MTSISEHVGALPYLGAIFDHGLFWAWFWAVFASWGMMNLLAILVEHRVLLPSQQYQSFYKGDLWGLPVIVAATLPMIASLPATHGHYYQSLWWHLLWLAVGVAVGVGMTVSEYMSGAYTWEEIWSPLKLYHNVVVFGLFIYWIFGCGLPGVIHSRLGIRGILDGGFKSVMIMLILITALVYWASLVVMDIRMSEEERAEKRAHIAVSPRETLVALPLAVALGVGLVLLSSGNLVSVLLVAAFLAGWFYYGTTAAFDTAGKARPRPWAHVPFKRAYAAPWKRKPWPFWTKGLDSPRGLVRATL